MPPAIHELRLRIEHSRAEDDRRAEIKEELRRDFGLIFRPLGDGVGVWEKRDLRRKAHKDVAS
jgi:hypothetical protein